MTKPHDRERALEDKYILDFERSFETRARRDRLLAQWVADLIGRNDTEVYVDEVLAAGQTEAGDDDVLRKVLADFSLAGRPRDEEELREKMRALLFEAAGQLESESRESLP